MTTLVQELYQSARTKVMIGNEYSEWFHSTVGVRQGCILSPSIFNLFLERIMIDALEDFDGGVKCGGITINNLRFADNIDLVTEDKESPKDITERLDTACRRYGMEISTDKSKTMITGIVHNLTADDTKILVTVSDVLLEQVKSFNYLGSIVRENLESEGEIRRRIGAATSTLVKLERVKSVFSC